MNGRIRFKKIREEEENLKNITEELQEERRIQEDEVWTEFEEYMRS